MTREAPPVEALEVAVYRVPTPGPEADGTLEWDATTVVVVHARAGGVAGLGWTYADESAGGVVHRLLAPAVVGGSAFDVARAAAAGARAVRKDGRAGVAAAALSAVDVALWDLKARLLDVALADLLGRARDAVPAYGSGGFTSDDEGRLREQVVGWVEGDGVHAVKMKIAESAGGDVPRDLRRVDVARAAAGTGVELFVDANGGYARGQAVRVAHELDDRGVTWFEEPVTADDLAGLRAVRAAARCDVSAGEYSYSPIDVERLLAADAVDCVQADVTRCGGITGWRRAAAVAAAHGTDLSAHCAPQLSAHVACAVPNARHVEWFADHARCDALLLDGCLAPRDGLLRPDLSRPGHGLAVAERAERFRVA